LSAGKSYWGPVYGRGGTGGAPRGGPGGRGSSDRFLILRLGRGRGLARVAPAVFPRPLGGGDENSVCNNGFPGGPSSPSGSLPGGGGEGSFGTGSAEKKLGGKGGGGGGGGRGGRGGEKGGGGGGGPSCTEKTRGDNFGGCGPQLENLPGDRARRNFFGSGWSQKGAWGGHGGGRPRWKAWKGNRKARAAVFQTFGVFRAGVPGSGKTKEGWGVGGGRIWGGGRNWGDGRKEGV